jgi:hypothetical protein
MLHYRRLEAGLPADTTRFVEFVPLDAFVSKTAEIALPDGVVLRPMIDSSAAAEPAAGPSCWLIRMSRR